MQLPYFLFRCLCLYNTHGLRLLRSSVPPLRNGRITHRRFAILNGKTLIVWDGLPTTATTTQLPSRYNQSPLSLKSPRSRSLPKRLRPELKPSKITEICLEKTAVNCKGNMSKKFQRKRPEIDLEKLRPETPRLERRRETPRL